jgi:hypothetical protein
MLAAFLAQHPEIVRNPEYYFGRYQDAPPHDPVASEIRQTMWGFSVVLIVATVFGVCAWIIRQIIDYRRWLRASAAQKEVHTKLLDRLTNNADLIAYLESPAGRRLLDAGSVPADIPAVNRLGAPVHRILWSLQLGVVAVIVGVPLWFLHHEFESAVRQAFVVVGVVITSLGIGFIASAWIAWTTSARLGLLGASQSQP